MSRLQELVDQYRFHDKEEHQHLIAKCKIVAIIRNEELWRKAKYASFDEFMQMNLGVKHSKANLMAQIGNTFDDSAIAELKDLRLSHLEKLMATQEHLRPATLQLLEMIPADKVTVGNIQRLADYVEQGISTGAWEVSEGMQLTPAMLAGIESGYLLELVETQKRKFEHVSGKRQAPTASFSGYSLNECLQNPHFLNLPSASPSSVAIYDRGESVRVVISLMKSGERV